MTTLVEFTADSNVIDQYFNVEGVFFVVRDGVMYCLPETQALASRIADGYEPTDADFDAIPSIN